MPETTVSLACAFSKLWACMRSRVSKSGSIEKKHTTHVIGSGKTAVGSPDIERTVGATGGKVFPIGTPRTTGDMGALTTSFRFDDDDVFRGLHHAVGVPYAQGRIVRGSEEDVVLSRMPGAAGNFCNVPTAR